MILSEKQLQNLSKSLGEEASTNQQTDRQTDGQTDRQTHHYNQYILENLSSSIFKSNDTANWIMQTVEMYVSEELI